MNKECVFVSQSIIWAPWIEALDPLRLLELLFADLYEFLRDMTVLRVLCFVASLKVMVGTFLGGSWND